MNNKNIINQIKNNSSSKVRLAASDIDGVLRGKIISKDKFLDIAEKSMGFCNVIFGWDSSDICYPNAEITGWHTAYPDSKATLDLTTYREVPWNNNLPFFLADFSNDETMSESACPRTLLKRVISKAEKMNYAPVFAQEFEWFNFIGTSNELSEGGYTNLKPITPGMFGYSLLRPTQYQDYFNELFDFLEKFDVQLEGLHTETGPGVYEAAIRYDTVLNAADKAVLFKNSVKEIAYRHGIIASFMAKWNQDLPGCSGHLHQSLWNSNRTENLFMPEKDGKNMSKIMESYLAGILYCLPHIMPMYSPTINCYKRLIEGAWSPTTISWGYENRTTAVRVITGDQKVQRMEMRLPASDSNPYLAMAASLASGLYGIEHNLELTLDATNGSAYADSSLVKLPSDLKAATNQMRDSQIANELFGEKFVKHYCITRDWEWEQFSKAVTNWELKKYFEVI